jgi:phage terminase small subunit
MEKKDKLLTPQQTRFCIAHASGKNITESAQIAGYSQPEKSGSRLLRRVEIRRCVDDHLQNFLTAEGLTESWVLKELKNVYQSAMHSEHWQSAIASLKQISEIGGYSNRVNKSEVKLVASFENLLEKTPLDITPSINAVGFSSDKTSPEILVPDDTRSDLGPAESR